MERWTWLVDLFRCEDNRSRRTGAYVSSTLAPYERGRNQVGRFAGQRGGLGRTCKKGNARKYDQQPEQPSPASRLCQETACNGANDRAPERCDGVEGHGRPPI